MADPPHSRLVALSACIASLHQLFGPAQHIINNATRVAQAANQPISGPVDVVVCTTGGNHLLDSLSMPDGAYQHNATGCPPLLLGFECHAVLRDRLGEYDYYAYLEDDLISRDPWLFVKLGWFTEQLGDDVLLQANRYEVGPLGLVHKAYLDGDLDVGVTAPFQDVGEAPSLTSRVMGTPLTFRRARNPHAGCFFLNAPDGSLGESAVFPRPRHELHRPAGERSDARGDADVPRLQAGRGVRQLPRDPAFRHGVPRATAPAG